MKVFLPWHLGLENFPMVPMLVQANGSHGDCLLFQAEQRLSSSLSRSSSASSASHTMKTLLSRTWRLVFHIWMIQTKRVEEAETPLPSSQVEKNKGLVNHMF